MALRRGGLTVLVMWLGLQVFRVYLPSVIYYLGERWSPVRLALYALATFALVFAAPILLRALGERAALAVAAVGIAAARIGVQIVTAPVLDLAFSTAGVVFWSWFVVLWQTSPRDRVPGGAPALALGLPLAFLLDAGSRAMLFSYDLAWRDGAWPLVAVLALVGAAMALLWGELRATARAEWNSAPDTGNPLNRIEMGHLHAAWPLLGLGPVLYLCMALLYHAPVWVAATGGTALGAYNFEVNGLSDTAAGVAAAASAALGAVVCVVVAGRPSLQRRSWAAFAGAVLAGCLALRLMDLGPAWLWLAAASPALWYCAGVVLGGARWTEWMPRRQAAGSPVRRQPASAAWRTALALFLGLDVMLVVVFVIGQYQALWMEVAAAVVLLIAAVGAGRGRSEVSHTASAQAAGAAEVARPGEKNGLAFRPGAARQAQVLGTVLAGVLVVALCEIWALLDRPPAAAAAPAAAGAPARPLRVMTYNIHQGMNGQMHMDLEALAAAIAAQQPDVVGLNEINRGRAPTGFVDTLPYISRRVGLPYVFGCNSADGLYGNALLSRYPVHSWTNTHYDYNTTELRGLLRAYVLAPGGPLTFYVTHLDHIGGPKNARSRQVSQALSLWNAAPRSLLMGDLNAEPGKAELQGIYRAGWVDALAAGGRSDAFTYWDPVPTPGRRIDYIFLTPDLALGKAWVPQVRASDHLPVAAELK